MGKARLAFEKPTKRSTLKARKDRNEVAIKKLVRAACVLRDGHCRMTAGRDDVFVGLSQWIHSPCEASSEWAHFGGKRRARTRGQAAEIRHTSAGSLMLCQIAHRSYDSGKLKITALTKHGCDGRLKFRWSK